MWFAIYEGGQEGEAGNFLCRSLISCNSCNRSRVRSEIFKGRDMEGAHRSGSEGACLAILGYSAAAYCAYAAAPSVLTGFCLGMAPPLKPSNSYHMLLV